MSRRCPVQYKRCWVMSRRCQVISRRCWVKFEQHWVTSSKCWVSIKEDELSLMYDNHKSFLELFCILTLWWGPVWMTGKVKTCGLGEALGKEFGMGKPTSLMLFNTAGPCLPLDINWRYLRRMSKGVKKRLLIGDIWIYSCYLTLIPTGIQNYLLSLNFIYASRRCSTSFHSHWYCLTSFDS
jgi:hypothetical protein